MKNAQGVFDYSVTVISARWDDDSKEWMYTLTDWAGRRIAGETRERQLG